MKRIAIVPGSFDPITVGHMDIIKRAVTIFDQVIVLVVINADKHPSFTTEERVDMIRRSIAGQGLDTVQVDSYQGLLVDYAKQAGACAIVKGLRAVSDFEYEFQMALINKELNMDVETVFLSTSSENLYLSSSVVKQIASFGGDIARFVPSEICSEILERLQSAAPLHRVAAPLGKDE